MKLQTYFFFFFSLLIFACKKQSVEVLNDRPVLTEYKIEKSKNTDLTEDLAFVIKGDSITSSHRRLYNKKLIPTFESNVGKVQIGDLTQESALSEVDFSDLVTYTLTSGTGEQRSYYVKINWLRDSLPHIYVNTAGGAPVISKSDYLNASISIDGKGQYKNYSGTTQIRGRGNSTWGMPKKPYRLKLTTKSEMFGLAEERDWVMLANYLDPTLMLNSVAMKIGQQLAIPYTNTIIPVNLSLNNEYVGSYNFTQQIEVGKDRVNIGDAGYLLELDTNYDEDFQFRSANYNLPVMIKSPDLETAAEMEPIIEAFTAFENLLVSADFPNNAYKDHIDINSVADFLIVHFLTANEETNHPKSTYMHKTSSGKFTMGPIWDFDWGYGFEGTAVHFSQPTKPFFWGHGLGSAFFRRFLNDPAFVAILKQKWTAYKTNSLGDLFRFIDESSLDIQSARNEDYKVWNTGNGNFMADVVKLKNWLTERAAYLDIYINSF